MLNASTEEHGYCNVPCRGLPAEICGGQSHLSVYRNNDYTGPSQGGSVNPRVGPFSFRGCYIDDEDRIMPDNVVQDVGMTVAICFAIAGDTPRYIGVQNGKYVSLFLQYYRHHCVVSWLTHKANASGATPSSPPPLERDAPPRASVIQPRRVAAVGVSPSTRTRPSIHPSLAPV